MPTRRTATSAWSSAWTGLEVLRLAFATAGVILAGHAGAQDAAAAPYGDWFAADCGAPADTRPAAPAPQLLRVLTEPGAAGFDAVLLRTPDGWLHAPHEVFEALGVAPPAPALWHGGTRYHALDRLPALRYAVDACRQTLSVDASALRAATSRRLWQTPDAPTLRPEPGGWVQAQLQYLDARELRQHSALIDAALFGGNGLARTDLLHDGSGLTRLETRWQYDDPASLTRLTLGDAITRGGAFGRSVRFGGVQWGTDFSLRPDLVTFPLPGVSDAAALPSAVDVYVDNQLRGRERVPAGPFELAEVPVLSGAGEIQLVITDLLGRSRVVRYAFYASPVLLRPGLADYSVEAGFTREAYGQQSLGYDEGFVAGTWRRGVSELLTVEVHGEASEARRVAGAGFNLLLPPVGVLGAGLAQGGGDSRGGELSLSLDRQGQTWSYSAQHTVTDAGFLRIGERRPASLRRSLLRGTWHARAGSLSAGWIDTLGVEGRVRTLNAGYSQHLWRGISVNLGGAWDLSARGNHSALLTLAWSLSPAWSAYTYAQHDDAGTTGRVGLHRNPLHELDWSARAGIDYGLIDRATLGGDLRLPQATLHGDVETGDDDTAMRLGLDSGLVALGPDWIWTRPLSGPFALVQTDSADGISVQLENRAAGSVHADAPLLLADLRPYQRNRVSVAQADFGIEQRLEGFEREVEIPGYGGVRVRFTADARPARRLRLLLPDGSPVPAGADLVVPGHDQNAFIGLRGETALSHRAGRHTLFARWASQTCRADLALTAADTLLLPPLDLSCVPVDGAAAPAPAP